MMQQTGAREERGREGGRVGGGVEMKRRERERGRG